MEITKKEVMEILKELEEATMESLEASRAEVDIKLKKQKAHKRLSLARDAVRSITFN